MRLIDADSIDYDDYWHNKGFSIRDCQKAQQLINEQPTVEAITIPKGATNGDMLTALFGEKALITLDTHNYLKKWWDAPYKRGNEE